VVNPNSAVTGRSSIYAEVSWFDHEEAAWIPCSNTERTREFNADGLLQAAINAGHDDVRLLMHITGSVERPLT
jgi:hypothetical protein